MVSLLMTRSRHLAPCKLSRKTRKLLQSVQPYTMSDPLRLVTLNKLVQELSTNGVAGDIVECGVCNGGSAAVMATAVVQCPERSLWLYDTFEGIPQAHETDGPLAQTLTGHFVGSVQMVREALSKVGYPLERVTLKKGLFRETFKDQLPGNIALLHIDADWYESVLLALQTLYPLVSDGGFIVLDDFGHWEGSRKAFYDFCRAESIQPLLERVGATQAFWRKGLEHNRDLYGAFEYGFYRPK